MHGFTRSKGVKAAVACFALALAGMAVAGSADRFTVKDSIEMSVIAGAAGRDPKWGYAELGAAPTQDRAVILLKRGNLRTGENEFSLLSWSAADTLSFINAPADASAPIPQTLLQESTSGPFAAIERVRWTSDGRRLYMIRREAEAPWNASVHVMDIDRRTTDQVIGENIDVSHYQLMEEQQLLFFTSLVPLFDEEKLEHRRRHGFVVRGEYLGWVQDGRQAARQQLYVKRLPQGPIIALGRNASCMLPGASAISPDGARAVLSCDLASMPEYWPEYWQWDKTFAAQYGEMPPPQPAGSAAEPQPWVQKGSRVIQESDVFGGRFEVIRQFFLADLATGEIEPLLDSPTTLGEQRQTFAWSPDGSRVAISPVRMPIEGLAGETRKRWSRALAMVDIDVRSGQVTPLREVDISQAGIHGGLEPGSIVSRDARGIVMDLPGQGGESERVARPWTARGWSPRVIKVDVKPRAQAQERLRLRIVQSDDVPPQIEATDTLTGKRRTLTDLNPGLRSKALGKVEIVEWTDKYGMKWGGQLLMPPGFSPGDRLLPLVLQTYANMTGQFLVDGANNSGYAARAFGGRGMAVLQTDCRYAESTALHGEANAAIACYEGAIDMLSQRGVIDPARVGLLGFSRTGMHVQNALSFSRIKFAAAHIADSVQGGPFNYFINYGTTRPSGLAEWDGDVASMIGAPLYGEGIKTWLEKSPFFHLDKVTTPLRYEYHSGPDTLLGVGGWDTFVMLKRMNRPVEMLVLPDEAHNVFTPLKRFTSQQGSVDWFAFWLLGEERLEPMPDTPETAESLRGQYERWRLLRQQHEAVLSAQAH